ncbi:hypothetical protein SPW_5063 [Streptomyces sp. W007]|nr:hypothetical protein SPW_5063 [Streptomyces sp. W007]
MAYGGFPRILFEGHVVLAFLGVRQDLEGIDVMTVNGGLRRLS